MYYCQAQESYWRRFSGIFFLLLCILLANIEELSAKAEEIVSPSETTIFRDDISMPGVTPAKHDQYLCTGKKLDSREAFIVQYEAHSENNRAHHILLFGCNDVDENNMKKGFWNCGSGNICSGMKIMFAWAKNAPPTKLPKDVGFRTGGMSNVDYLVLEIHYAHPLNESDSSGITLYKTYEQQKYVAGIFLLLTYSTRIPPNKPKIHSDVNCLYQKKTSIHPFAYRVHAHSLSVVITGYKYDQNTGKWTMLGKGNPQWPQAFYPMSKVHTVEDGNYLAARCTYNSTGRDRWTHIGETAADEMCNFYIMYYTDAEKGSAFDECLDVESTELVDSLPEDSDVPLPRNLLLEEHAHSGMENSHSAMGGSHYMNQQEPTTEMDKKWHNTQPLTYDEYSSTKFSSDDPVQFHEKVSDRGKVSHTDEKEKSGKLFGGSTDVTVTLTNMYTEVSNWPSITDGRLGQVSAVTLNLDENIVIFHRANHVWQTNSFDMFNNYAKAKEGPIKDNTILILDSESGMILHEWGKDLFYMPHGLSIDKDGNVWITDVALHQVMKFPPAGGKEALLTLGVQFESGSDNHHFCKPTSVAVATNGEFFVADGYCNSRILKYSPLGDLLFQFGRKTPSILGFTIGTPPPYAFSIPHKLALAEEKDLICVADRENGRIQCFSIANGTFHCQMKPKQFGDRLFAISYSKNGFLFAVNGANNYNNDDNVQAFVLNLTTQTLLGSIRPSSQNLKTPHDIVTTPDGANVYIVEIGPNKIWKFLKSNILQPNDEMQYISSASNLGLNTSVKMKTAIGVENKAASPVSRAWYSDSLMPSLIIIAVLAIPVLLIMLITAVIRLKKQGNFKSWTSGGHKQANGEKFNFGNFLNPHKGFDPVKLEESDGGVSSDSEVDEFTAATIQKA